MTHPVEQLVDYVDGTLPAGERAVVDAHLRTCARCRQEVTLARGAASVLASLPEVQAPEGLGAAAIRRAEDDAAERAPEVAALSPRRDSTQRTGAPAWYRWGGVAGAAAVILLLVVVALPRLGGESDTLVADDATATEAAEEPIPAARSVDEEDRDYGAEDVVRLAARYEATAGTPPRANDAEAGPSVPVTFADTSFGGNVACLQTATPTLAEEGPPVRLIRATYEGTPAVLGVYVTGPGADQPADSVLIWVVSAEDCTDILHFTQVRI